jgi:hypothetical protein
MSGLEWRPAPGWDGYEVSADGQVRSWRKLGQKVGRASSPRLLKRNENGRGYLQVRLNEEGHSSPVHVHRLVGEAFLGPLPAGMETRHLDGDKSNNAASNLRYGTRIQNRRDRIAHGTDHNLIKTHCPSRHLYDAANTRVSPQGHRICRACHAETSRRSRNKAVA